MQPRAESEIACIKIWSREPSQRWHVLRYGAEGRKPSQCIKVGNACFKIWNRVFSALCDNFRKIQKFLPAPPARIIITPADN